MTLIRKLINLMDAIDAEVRSPEKYAATFRLNHAIQWMQRNG